MDLRPVEQIGAVSRVHLKPNAADVAPPFAIDGPGRMEEDSYSAGAERPDRGLEEEDAEELKEEEPDESSVQGARNKVNCFA
jgi:hypothetical protein